MTPTGWGRCGPPRRRRRGYDGPTARVRRRPGGAVRRTRPRPRPCRRGVRRPASHRRATGVKCTSRLSRARPESRWVLASLRPSPSATSSSTVRPSSAWFSSQAIWFDHLDEALVALLHDGLRHLVVEHGGGGAGALGVLEGERAGEPGPPYDVQGRLEVLLGLAREAHDDVGGDGGLGHRGADPLDDAEVLRLAVGPAHVLQHPVGARLQRHVQRRHHVGGLAPSPRSRRR